MTGIFRSSYRLGATPSPLQRLYPVATTTTTTILAFRSSTATLDLAGHAHLTAHLPTPKSRDEVMDVVVAKIISLLVLTVLSVLCGLLPLRLLINTPHIFSKNRKPVESFLCGLRLFSGGVYLATCFLHLLPDTRVKMATVMQNMGSRSTYAVPELLVISGFYAVVFMEQIIKTLYVSAENSDMRRKNRPKRHKRPEVYRSTLDDRDGDHSEDRFELTDDYFHNRSNRYDDCSDIKGNGVHDDDGDDDDDDDDDDEHNVLVEDDDDDGDDDDDDCIMESGTDSDLCSHSSHTCVKESLEEKENEAKQFQDVTLLRTQPRYHNEITSESCQYKEIVKNISHDKGKELPPVMSCSIVSVHATTPCITSSPAIITSMITSPSTKITSLSSSPLSSTTSTATTSAPKVTAKMSTTPQFSALSGVCGNSQTSSITTTPSISTSTKPTTEQRLPSVHHYHSKHHHHQDDGNNGYVNDDDNNDNDDINKLKQQSTLPEKYTSTLSTRSCQNHDTLITNSSCVPNHLPYNNNHHHKESFNDDKTDKTNNPDQLALKPMYPIRPLTTTATPHYIGHQLLNQRTEQYPKLAEPRIQYIAQDNSTSIIPIQENHINHENIHTSGCTAGEENIKSTFDSLHDKDNDSGIFSSKREGEEKFLEERRRLMTTTSSDNSIDKISECACSLQEFQVRQVVDELKQPELSASAHLRSIIYIMALAFHGIFEGMALGLQSMKNSVWALCFAIVIHRCVLAFKLGMDLCRGQEKQGTCFLCIGTFTLISALGIIIGILISSGASFYSDVSVPEAILQSLATGTIIYIVFLDILIKDLQGKDDLKRVSCTFVGFAMMAVVFAVFSS